MSSLTSGAVELRPAEVRHASVVPPWVTSRRELRWLSPSCAPPLTAEKVRQWWHRGGSAFVWLPGQHDSPVAYGELNPMEHEPGHCWLGHCIVSPVYRGKGWGAAFVRALVDMAFDTLDAVRVSLIVFPENVAAIQCYRRAGFDLVREEFHSFRDRPLERLLRFETAA